MTAAERLAQEVKRTRTHEEALAVAEGFMARKRREKRTRIQKPAAGPTKAAKKDAARLRLEALAEIRVELHRETGGTCVVCGLGLPFARMHAHHILSGPERQTEERRETMAPLHEKCHRWAHGTLEGFDQRDALSSLLAWCEATGREDASRSTRNRIAKIDEARRAMP